MILFYTQVCANNWWWGLMQAADKLWFHTFQTSLLPHPPTRYWWGLPPASPLEITRLSSFLSCGWAVPLLWERLIPPEGCAEAPPHLRVTPLLVGFGMEGLFFWQEAHLTWEELLFVTFPTCKYWVISFKSLDTVNGNPLCQHGPYTGRVLSIDLGGLEKGFVSACLRFSGASLSPVIFLDSLVFQGLC